MTPPATLSANDVRLVLSTYRDVLRDHQEVVNRLNVYPVPDGDTGTNMALTIESVVAGLDDLDGDPSMEGVCHAISHGSLMGARGNSGVILSQLLRGMAERFREVASVDASVLTDALAHADDLARKAVVRPIEGTILTVARAAAEGAAAALAADGDLASTAEGARAAAEVALAYTPEQLPALKQAGVVDSGGTGFLLLLDALCHITAERPLPVSPDVDSINVNVTGHISHEASDVGDLRYEVMYLLDAPDDTIEAFKEVWAGIGDSIVVVGGDGIYNCHIHTDDIGASIEAAIEIGRPRDIRVTDLAEQVVEEKWVREGAYEAEGSEVPSRPPPVTAIVAVVTGDGVGRIFRSLGVQRLVKGGQSMNPSTAELVEAVEATGASNVIILPNNKNIVPVAKQVNDLTGVSVSVVPTNSIVEGFASLLSYDPSSELEPNVGAMADSSSAVLAAEVTQAVRDTEVDAGVVHEGDWIGLTGDGIVAIAESMVVCATHLLETIVTYEHDLITIIEGEGSTASNTRRLSEWLAEVHPDVAVEVHHGGQPLYPYLFGIE
jgi:DAK2 domain fusion protein YloV